MTLFRRDGSEIGTGKSIEEIVERHLSDFCGADLSGVDLRDTDLRDAHLKGAKTDLQEQDETLSGVAEHREEQEQ